VNLKVNDGGNNASTNSYPGRAGNLDITAGGSIVQTDGNAVSAGGANVGLAYGANLSSTIGFTSAGAMTVTQTTGDLIATPFAAQSLQFQSLGGNVVFAGSSTFGTAPVTVAGAGNAVFNSGTVTFNGPLTASMPLSVAGGNLIANATVTAPALAVGSGSASFQVAPSLGSVNQTGGTLTISTGSPFDIASGTWTISGGQLNLPGAGTTVAAGATLAVAGGNVTYGSQLGVLGTLALSSGALGGAGPINNSGAITKSGTGVFTLAQAVNNSGTVSTVAGTLRLTGGGTHTGGFDTTAGATTDFQAGAHSFGDGAVFSGPGSFDGGGTLVLTGTGNGLVLAADTVTQLNALGFSGSGMLTNQGTTSGSGITLPGNFVNAAGATANLSNVTIGGNLLNYGNFNVGGTVTVAGLQAVQASGVLSIPSGSTLDMSNASGTFSWEDGTIGGTGTLGFSGGGTFLFAGTGDRVIDGLNFAFNNLTLPDGSLTLQSGSLTLSGNTVLPAGVALNLVGGTLTNNGTLDVGGDFSLTGGAFGGTGSLSMSGGSLSLPSGNSVAWTNSGALTNTGTLNLAGSTITNAIDNQGTINLGGGLNFTQTLTNRGTLNVQSGTSTFNSGVTQQSGDVVLSGGTLQGDLTLNAGSLRGNGTVDGTVTIGTVTMSPGASPGKLMVTGNLVLNAASVVNIELAGTTPTTRLRLDRGGWHGHAGRHAERQPDQRLQRPGGQQLLGAAVCQLHGRVLRQQLGDPDQPHGELHAHQRAAVGDGAGAARGATGHRQPAGRGHRALAAR
jgi:hypothetical protein